MQWNPEEATKKHKDGAYHKVFDVNATDKINAQAIAAGRVACTTTTSIHGLKALQRTALEQLHDGRIVLRGRHDHVQYFGLIEHTAH